MKLDRTRWLLVLTNHFTILSTVNLCGGMEPFINTFDLIYYVCKIMAESIKSRYKPSNPEKYQGNPNNIICRSSWERRFCVWCDKNENIISWASEEFSIPYMSPIDNRVHRYFPDYIIKVREKNNKIKNYVVEVKT